MANIDVKIVKTVNSDLKVVNSARVSMGKQHTEFDDKKDTRLIRYLATHAHWTPFVHNRDVIIFPLNSLTMRSHFKELIARIPQEGHAGLNVQFIKTQGETEYAVVKNSLYGWTQLLEQLASGRLYAEKTVAERILAVVKTKYPVSAEFLISENVLNNVKFNPTYLSDNIELYNQLVSSFEFYMFDVTFYETVPIFVARQRFKHMVGFDYNEVSRRYVDDAPQFFTVNGWRERPEGSIKQGSAGVSVKSDEVNERYEKLVKELTELYDEMVDKDKLNIAPEMARMILPQSMMTEYFVTGNFIAIQRLLEQRLDGHAQVEIQELAQKMQAEVQSIKDEMHQIVASGYDVQNRLASIGVF